MIRSLIKDGKVINVIMLEDGADWEPPEGCFVGPIGGHRGDSYDEGTETYTRPVKPARPDSEAAQEELSGLDTLLSRAEEDIIDVLIDKGVAVLDDFGTTIKANYEAKQNARDRRNA